MQEVGGRSGWERVRGHGYVLFDRYQTGFLFNVCVFVCVCVSVRVGFAFLFVFCSN